MAENAISIKIGADADEARRNVQAIASDIEDLADTLGGELGEQARAAAEKLRMLGQQDKLASNFLELQAAVHQTESRLKQLTVEARNYGAQIAQAGPPTAQEAAHLRQLHAEADRLGSTLAYQQTQLAQSASAMQKHGIATVGAQKSLHRIRADIDNTVQSVGRLDPRLKQATQSLHKVGDAAESTGRRMSAVGNAAHRMAAQMAAAFTVREAVQAAADMEKLQVGLQAVTGDAAKAAAEMEFVRELASRAGVDVAAAGDAWLGLAAATKGTAVEGKATRDVFDAVTTSMARAGKSSADTQRALLALAQMAGKGVVSMEEMRQQLGEALPGAFQAAASGMGITVAELGKLIESGQVAAQDLFPALTKGLHELYSGAPAGQTLAQELTNIKNAFAEVVSDIGAQGGNNALKYWAEVAQAAITSAGASIVALGKQIGVLMAAVSTWDFSGVSEAFAEIESEAANKLARAAQHNDVLRASIEAVGSEAERAALAAQQGGGAHAQAAVAADQAVPSYQALASAYAQVREELKSQITLAEKEVQAVKARGEAAVAEAALLGDERALRKAVGQAAADEAQAMTDLAERRQTEVDVLRAELDNKQALLEKSGQESQERRKQLQELEQLIERKQLEADRTRAQAAAAQANAKAKGGEAQAAQAALSAAQATTIARVAEAKETLALLQTQKQLAGQTEQLATMMGNEGAARRARIEQLQIDIEITQAKAEVQRREAEGAIVVAKAKMAELRAAGQLTQVKEAELNASIRLAQAKLKEADAIAQSTRVTEQAIRNIRRYGDATRRAADQTKSATREMAAGWREVAGAAQDAAKAAEQAASAPYGRRSTREDSRFEEGRRSSKGQELGKGVVEIGSSGVHFQNKDGFTSDASGAAIAAMESTAELNRRVAKLFGEHNIGNKDAIDAANLKLQIDQVAKYGLAKGPGVAEWYRAIREEYERLTLKISGGGQAVTRPGRRGDAGGGDSERRSGSSSGSTYVSNINLGGKLTKARFSDRQSQQDVQELLRQLTQAKGAAS